MNQIEIISTAIGAIFFLFVTSYYVLLLIPARKIVIGRKKVSVSIIVPAHNEEKVIASCIRSIMEDNVLGRKQIIVVDDGSTDRTAKIASGFDVELIRKKHTGKSDSLNAGLRKAKGDVIILVDGDSSVQPGTLQSMADAVNNGRFGAATCAVKVSNRTRGFGPWLHLEQSYNSLMRRAFCKFNMNAVTPGPCSAYRKDALLKVNGFSTDGFSEDADVTIRMVRAGYNIAFVNDAASYTVMPVSIKGFLRQRMRFIRGMIHLLKKHLKPGMKPLDIYTLPLFLFTYVQAVTMGSITIFKIFSDYHAYFASKNIYFNLEVARFFFDWFSIIGFTRWTYSVLTGAEPLTLLAILGICTTLMTYPLYIYAVLKFDRKIDIWHIIPLIFMMPFFLMIMAMAIISFPEIFRREQYNKWAK